jgi:hypothetical protein
VTALFSLVFELIPGICSARSAVQARPTCKEKHYSKLIQILANPHSKTIRPVALT